MAAFEGDPMSRDCMMYLRVDPARAMKEAAAKAADSKKWVWIPVPGQEGYVAAQVKSASGDNVTLETKDGKVSLLIKHNILTQDKLDHIKKSISQKTFCKPMLITFHILKQPETSYLYSLINYFLVILLHLPAFLRDKVPNKLISWSGNSPIWPSPHHITSPNILLSLHLSSLTDHGIAQGQVWPNEPP